MERLRGKRFMFVGDSLNRNQWESMVCLVQSAMSPGKKYVTWEDQRVVFHAVVRTPPVSIHPSIPSLRFVPSCSHDERAYIPIPICLV
jgi:hypothetical protein